jgi:RNA-directed DNA polymerase
LWRAWVAVRRNNGAPGIDKITLAQVEEYGVGQLLGELASELREGRYRPLPARRVFIPKPGAPAGEQRPLSIPAVRDRMVQAAAKIVLELVFEEPKPAKSRICQASRSVQRRAVASKITQLETRYNGLS